MKNWLIATLLIAVISTLVWYLFIRGADIVVSFKVNTYPETVTESLKAWTSNYQGLKIQSLNPGFVEAKSTIGDNSYHIEWEISMVNDSVSKVRAHFSELGNALRNRLLIPFQKTEIEEYALKITNEFRGAILGHLKNFKVKVKGIEKFEKRFCLFMPLKTTQEGKAFGMIGNYSYLSSFILINGLQTNGVPFVEVTNWDRKSGKLEYNLCYPIVKTDSLPHSQDFKYKEVPAFMAVKAIYNGNYITSDRAWYAINHYANKNDLNVSEKPVEVFHSNPHNGGNELEWVAEIFMPINSGE